MSRIGGRPEISTQHVYGLTLRVARWRAGASGTPLLFLNGIGAVIGHSVNGAAGAAVGGSLGALAASQIKGGQERWLITSAIGAMRPTALPDSTATPICPLRMESSSFA